MSTANLTRDETAARSAAITLRTVDVDLDVRHAADAGSPGFAVTSTLTFDASGASETWIDFIGDEVSSVVVNGAAATVEWDGARIRVRRLQRENVVTIRARGRYSRSGEGLHRFRDPVDDAVYLYTQYEPADARRVYPCFEQPDMKARWRFRVSAPASWRVLSGGVLEGSEPVPDGVRHTFAETAPLPSYITAVAAGPYHRVDGVWRRGAQQVDLGVLCRASLAAHLDADEIIDVTRRGLDLFTEAFDFDYPWGKYDQIFVPEYNLGAMENPGLVTFTEAYVFRGAATRAQREARANTILHEMAHMWFGDLVTMRWWDDLWLKESFADFCGAYANVRTGAHPDAWVSFASRRKGWASEQDQLPTTHPIVARIDDLEAAKLNFDGITYAKGASVLKQLVAFVGEDAFLQGARNYFAEHAFGNTTLADLLRALSAASGRDLTGWADAWLQTTGMSELVVDRDTRELRQDVVRPHRLHVGFSDWRDGRLVPIDDVSVELLAERAPVPGRGAWDAALIVPNVDDRTYAKVRLDARSIAAAERGLSTIDDALTRAVVWSALWNGTRDGLIPVTRYLETVARHAPAESSAALLSDAVAHAALAISQYAAEDDRDALREAWLELVWQSLHDAAAGSDAQLIWARALAAAAAVADQRAAEIRRMLEGVMSSPDGLRLDADLRWQWWTALAASGHADAGDADREETRDDTASGRTAAIGMRTAIPDARVRAAAWRRAWSDESLSNDHLDAVISGIRAGGRRSLIAAFDDDYFERIRPIWSGRSIEIARRLVRGLFPAADDLVAVDAWLQREADAPAALRRIVIEQRDALARALRVRAAQRR